MAIHSAMPVAQRAMLGLIQELGALGPKDKMMTKAAAALIKRFDEPLTESDLQAIAKLTNLDVAALRIAAATVGRDARTVEVNV